MHSNRGQVTSLGQEGQSASSMDNVVAVVGHGVDQFDQVVVIIDESDRPCPLMDRNVLLRLIISTFPRSSQDILSTWSGQKSQY